MTHGERWKQAAERYKAAAERGEYNPDAPFESDREKECMEFLQHFFSAANPDWYAARKLLKISGKMIELKKVKKEYETVKYVLTHEGFRRIVQPEWPFRLERHGIVVLPLTFRAIAALLAEGMVTEPVEFVFRRMIIQKIDEIANNSQLL